MPTAIAARLKDLQAEFETGQKMLAEIDAKRVTLVNTLLRIEGAIQVLKELSDTGAAATTTPSLAVSPDGGAATTPH